MILLGDLKEVLIVGDEIPSSPLVAVNSFCMASVNQFTFWMLKYRESECSLDPGL